MLGDAGEYYALSQFTFFGIYGTKMPDNWKAYDLIVEHKNKLLKVSVKTRSMTTKWKNSAYFQWDKEDHFDLLVLNFRSIDNKVESWVIPRKVVDEISDKPTTKAKNQSYREIKWKKLISANMDAYKENWALNFI